jgi:hypothetical protein
MPTINELPEFMMRVKLPNPNDYASCPSGDTDYEKDYSDALFKNKPSGFEIKYERSGVKWPTDSDGFTYVRLYCTDKQIALATAYDELIGLRKKLDAIKTLIL